MQISNTPKGMQVFIPMIFLFLIATGSSALAVDGVREISQACVATGCFPGDTAGFPVTLRKAGSYTLTSNLDVTDETDPEDVTAIVINTTTDHEGVVIDLNGFSIIGPTTCSIGTPPTSCSPLGSGIGIDGNDNRVTVRNGRIFGMGDDGVQLFSAGRVEDMSIESCGGDGIQSTQASLFLNNVTRRNGGNGISAGEDSLVKGNIIHGNIGVGILGNNFMGYGHNVINDNTGGAVSAGVQIANNLCDNALCP